MENSILKLENISVVFEKKDSLFSKTTKVGAVVDVNLDINKGEILAVVGESGCGKTTMGKIMTGLFKPTKGNVIFNGKNINKMSSKEYGEFRTGVQMVQQDSYAALNPARTIFQSLSAPILEKKIVKNINEAYDKVCELLRVVELNPPEQFLEKYPHQLSGGQRQRILLARAISLNPKVIIADEPVSMIDVSLRISVLNLMAKLNKEMEIAFVYITHDLATAKYIAKNGKILVMYLGKIVEYGNVLDTIKNPKHPYLQALIAAVPVPNPKLARGMNELKLKSIEMPNPSDPPSGCRFNPRCVKATSICEKKEPELIEINSRKVACHQVELEKEKL